MIEMKMKEIAKSKTKTQKENQKCLQGAKESNKRNGKAYK